MKHWLALLLFGGASAGFLVVFWILIVSIRSRTVRLEPSSPAVLFKNKPALFIALITSLAMLAAALLLGALRILRILTSR